MRSGPEPHTATLVGWHHVYDYLGRAPTWQDLDQMAENNVFLSREHRLLWDLYGTFRKEEASDGFERRN